MFLFLHTSINVNPAGLRVPGRGSGGQHQREHHPEGRLGRGGGKFYMFFICNYLWLWILNFAQFGPGLKIILEKQFSSRKNLIF